MGHVIVDVMVDSASVGPVPSYTFSAVLADHVLEATFGVAMHAVAAVAVGPGAARVRPSQSSYAYGTLVRVIASPQAHYDFLGWSGDTAATRDTLALVVRRDWALTATFADTTAPTDQVVARRRRHRALPARHRVLGGAPTTRTASPAVDLPLRVGPGIVETAVRARWRANDPEHREATRGSVALAEIVRRTAIACQWSRDVTLVTNTRSTPDRSSNRRPAECRALVVTFHRRAAAAIVPHWRLFDPTLGAPPRSSSACRKERDGR